MCRSGEIRKAFGLDYPENFTLAGEEAVIVASNGQLEFWEAVYAEVSKGGIERCVRSAKANVHIKE